jgi:hypothetical protein
VIIVVLIIGDNAVYYLLSADCDWLVMRATAVLTSTRENRIYIIANHASGTTQYFFFPFHDDFHDCRLYLSAYCKYTFVASFSYFGITLTD